MTIDIPPIAAYLSLPTIIVLAVPQAFRRVF